MIWSLHATFWGLRKYWRVFELHAGVEEDQWTSGKIKKESEDIGLKMTDEGLVVQVHYMCSGKAVPIAIFSALSISGATD